jgi:predicted dienelactone hydrolase
MSGFVYFLSSADRVKVGYSVEPARRISALSTASPFPIVVIATIPGTEAEERAIHRGLSSSRRYGEWFERTSEVETLLAAVTSKLVTTGDEAAAFVGGSIRPAAGSGSFEGIFGNWTSVKEMAADLGLKYTTAQVMRLRGRVSPNHWPAIIEALAKRGVTVTADDLMKAYCAAPVTQSEAA